MFKPPERGGDRFRPAAWKAAVLQMWLHFARSGQSYSQTRFVIRAKQEIGGTARLTKGASAERCSIRVYALLLE